MILKRATPTNDKPRTLIKKKAVLNKSSKFHQEQQAKQLREQQRQAKADKLAERLAAKEAAKAERQRRDPNLAPPLPAPVLKKPFPPMPDGLKHFTEAGQVLHRLPYAKAKGLKHAAFKQIATDDLTVIPHTVFVVNVGAHKIVHLLTRNADGQLIGWTSCGRCQQHVMNCRCPSLRMPSYVTRSTKTKTINQEVESDEQADQEEQRDQTTAGPDQGRTPGKPSGILRKRGNLRLVKPAK